MTDNTPDRLHHGVHGGDGRFIRSAEVAERDARACELRSQGWTYAAIAAELGYYDKGGARLAVERALDSIVAEPAAALRTLELNRLDGLWRKALEVMNTPHVAVSNGRVVEDPRTGEPVADDMPKLAAIDRLLKIMERRSRLLGLDHPVRAEVITVDLIEGEIARLGAQLGIIQEGEVIEQ